MPKGKEYILYKIYAEDCLLYLGRTSQPLQARLHGHFFKKPMLREINIEIVTRIEYAVFPTQADMFLMEIYYINKLKPPLNKDDKARDELTITLPEVQFQEYICPLMDKWREEIRVMDEDNEKNRKLKLQLELEKEAKHHEIFSRDIPLEEKLELWSEWKNIYYEPVRAMNGCDSW